MVFNIGAALLDAVVLAMSQRVHTGIRLHRRCGRSLKFLNLCCIQFCAGYRKMSVWKRMIWNVGGATGVTTGLRRKEEHSLIRILASGIGILQNERYL